ncbi:4'-phosphopantetheinyl transferase family protein [Streptantibioticus ferralitis]|uniref:4'-phosphopantetheinyl transferase superfamily protein n=1 Tax=Streptantibioticus ferralitis TaxID=236510 RepID=A0ABT5YV67_9ACTN|nr:4'-phosphopantetheinyl transferase superfamily protein [Streptantibioticus ferralitis]MDF2255475.1 4'-phosphopantetheinyl transferase superfamily protein [Streptantibioticus ferralitis]
MISGLLPATVACAEAFEDDGEDDLFPQERELIGNSVERRRREFTTVRACARRALADLGLPPAPVLPGVRNVPQWPAGIVGSMTHCDGYRAAALARAADLVTVGIDAEPDLPLRQGMVESIALPSELSWVRAAVPGSVHRDRLLFSAKECVYKAWYPMMRTELDFDDAEIAFTETADGSGTFDARVLRPARNAPGQWVDAFAGRWTARRGLLVTTISLAATAVSVN